MKVRIGFVSNSSSSSFIVSLNDISASQLKKLLNFGDLDKFDYWTMNVSYSHLSGWTTMDNDDLEDFMKEIGIDLNKVKWGE